MKNKKTIILSIIIVFCMISLFFNFNYVNAGVYLTYNGNNYYSMNATFEPWTQIIEPSSLHYGNKTFIVWQGDIDNDGYMEYYGKEYNHDTNTWSSDVQIYETPGSGMGDDDSHGCPSIVRTDDGYLHVFCGSHQIPFYHIKSDNPDDISSWTYQGTLFSTTTYSHTFLTTSGRVYLFYRGDGVSNMCYQYSDDNCSSWSGEYDIISFSGSSMGYGTFDYDSAHNRFHCSFIEYSSARRDVFYAYLNLADHHMYNVSGYDCGITIDSTEGHNYCKIWDSGSEQANGARVHFDSNGYPYIIFTHDYTSFDFIYWNGSSWSARQVITYADHLWSSKDFIVHNSSSITAFLSTNGSSSMRGGDIERWSWNGSSWIQEEVIATEFVIGDSLNVGGVPYNYTDSFMLFFSGFDDSDKTTPLPVFAWGINATTNTIEFKSINNQGNNGFLITGRRYFNWTSISGATKYQLQISNYSSFNTTFLDLSNISEGSSLESMPGGNFTVKGNYVEFYLPYAYNISWYGSHYYRVRAYSTS